MDVIVKMKFGSHLYGTATDSSDSDYKGVFMPSKEQVFLGRIPKSINTGTKKGNKSKNTSEDMDTEMYSLHYFVHLACQGETAVLDMLHAPDSMIIDKSGLWDEIVGNRHRFYTKNLKAFVGYARRQASKYGIKGSRLSDAKAVLEFIDSYKLETSFTRDVPAKVKDVWDILPSGEHILKHEPDLRGIRMYEVCGRKVGETATLNHLYAVVKHFHDVYGERARKAANNEGIDWKAVSHAFRAAFQVKQILAEGTITFPLKEADYLREVKVGKLDYQGEVAPWLNSLIEEVEGLSRKSSLPEKVDRVFWDDFIIKAIDERVIIKVIEKEKVINNLPGRRRCNYYAR